ncbi:DinB family protein [Ornithinibacillus halophilus]|uniref:DinB superfamily protein n=1 Tax=Ornithinibacillus halophilus TaxID=930117 RepID=A0A1M5LJV5_9BACI|nr:DinB family protein [Ornithinibacillus halophilus]SHG64643.1 DinB superfamily protein [Ornithinibacillus halophilus]
MSSIKQFNLARTSLITFIKDLDEEVLDRQSEFFDNTIRWHIGNTLLFNEKLLFVHKEKSQKLAKEYAELFSSDISVSDWTVDAPNLEQLLDDLEDQRQRINSFDEHFWKSNVKFKAPHGHIETHGDLLIMLSQREAETLGKIKAMKRVLDAKS